MISFLFFNLISCQQSKIYDVKGKKEKKILLVIPVFLNSNLFSNVFKKGSTDFKCVKVPSPWLGSG